MEIDWDARFAAVQANRPQCACGCGELVESRFKSAEDMRRDRASSGRYARYVFGHQCRSEGFKHKISDRQVQAVFGTLLGDASLLFPHRKAKHPRLSWNHGPEQTAWADYKAKFLSGFAFKQRAVENKGYGMVSIRGTSSCHPVLLDIYRVCFADGKKTVTENWLDQIGAVGLAWWYCDDGHYNPKARIAHFHVEGFDPDSQEVICRWLDKRFDGAVLQSASGRRFIRMRVGATQRLFDEIREHVPEFFAYKMAAGSFCQRGLGI